MDTLAKIMYHMAGHGVIEALVDTLRKNDSEFVEAEKAYLEACEILHNELPEGLSPTLDEYITASENNTISRVTYAGYLGYRVNLENFHHPVRVDFVKMDTIDYVKDHIMGHFPVCYEAAKTQNAFHKHLPEELKHCQEAVDDYFLHMECAGPKLAHYAGYVIANHLLPWVEPGYRADWFQTACFRNDLLRYMGYLPL